MENNQTHSNLLVSGAALIVIGIALGAFGAHDLKDRLNLDQINSFEVGVRYQIYHGLALLIIGFNVGKLGFSTTFFKRLILAGVLLFSGSIYVFACKDLLGLQIPKAIYLLTPLGGVSLISAWLLFLYHLLKSRKA